MSGRCFLYSPSQWLLFYALLYGIPSLALWAASVINSLRAREGGWRLILVDLLTLASVLVLLHSQAPLRINFWLLESQRVDAINNWRQVQQEQKQHGEYEKGKLLEADILFFEDPSDGLLDVRFVTDEELRWNPDGVEPYNPWQCGILYSSNGLQDNPDVLFEFKENWGYYYIPNKATAHLDVLDDVSDKPA